jgi:hypothetical protein
MQRDNMRPTALLATLLSLAAADPPPSTGHAIALLTRDDGYCGQDCTQPAPGPASLLTTSGA